MTFKILRSVFQLDAGPKANEMLEIGTGLLGGDRTRRVCGIDREIRNREVRVQHHLRQKPPRHRSGNGIVPMMAHTTTVQMMTHNTTDRR